MAFFGTPQPQMMPEEEYPGLIPTRQQGGGILGFLRNPAVSAALGGMSRGFTQAALAGAPTGQGFAAGLAGGAEGVGSWEEAQAKAAAERVNEIARQRSQNAWNTDTGRRYQLKARELQRAAQAQGKEIGEDVAMELAMGYVDMFPYDQRRALAELQQGFQREVIGIKNEMKIEEEGRAADVAADVADAETTARLEAEKRADIGAKVEKAEDALAELQGMESDLKKLPSPVGMAVEDIKAYWGAGNPQTQAVIGRIKRRAGAMLKYVDRLPGAATDADREVFMASAGILGSTDPKVTPEQKIAAVQDAISAYRRLIAKYDRKSGKPAAPAKPSGIRIDAQGRIIK